MNIYDYKNLQFITLNVAGWGWRTTNERWENRLKRICAYIREKMSNPFIIALQELQLAGGKYLGLLEEQFPEYYIVLPDSYNNQPRSVVSLILINKELCESYNIRTLEGLENSLRYNFVHINTHIEGLCFRILNVNIPHNSLENAAEWYKKDREELRALFVKNIIELANNYRSEPDLKLIVLGDFNSVPDDALIHSLAYSYNRPMIDAVKECKKNEATWRNLANGSENRLDYILYSTGMLRNAGLSAKFTLIDEQTILQKMSDHVILFGGITLEELLQ